MDFFIKLSLVIIYFHAMSSYVSLQHCSALTYNVWTLNCLAAWWNVCFIFSLREIKYDEHKVKKLLFIAAYQKKIENNMKLMIVTVFKIKNPCWFNMYWNKVGKSTIYTVMTIILVQIDRRPEFNKLLNDAEHRKFDIILCKTQSRFTRELELVEKYIHGLFPIWDSFYQHCR